MSCEDDDERQHQQRAVRPEMANGCASALVIPLKARTPAAENRAKKTSASLVITNPDRGSLPPDLTTFAIGHAITQA